MFKVLIALAVVLLTAGTAAADDKAEVINTVNQFVDSFNKGDTKTAAATCADQTSIIDEIPPYEWHGTGACSKWMSDYDADAKKNEITEGVVTLSAPKHVDITGADAYVVIPASYKLKRKGKAEDQTGSILTVSLHKAEAGWRITAWSWARN